MQALVSVTGGVLGTTTSDRMYHGQVTRTPAGREGNQKTHRIGSKFQRARRDDIPDRPSKDTRRYLSQYGTHVRYTPRNTQPNTEKGRWRLALAWVGHRHTLQSHVHHTERKPERIVPHQDLHSDSGSLQQDQEINLKRSPSHTYNGKAELRRAASLGSIWRRIGSVSPELQRTRRRASPPMAIWPA